MKIENKKITTYQICLVALAVGVNIVGGQIALFLKLPVYLDSIGTIFAGAVLGPWFGMIPNILSGIFMGMTVDIYSLYFAPVGIVSGLVFQKMSVKKGRIFLAAAVISVPGTIVSALINAVLFGGVTSSGSSILVQMLSKTPLGLTGSIFTVQFLTDYADRCISVFAVSALITAMGGGMVAKLSGRINNNGTI